MELSPTIRTLLEKISQERHCVVAWPSSQLCPPRSTRLPVHLYSPLLSPLGPDAHRCVWALTGPCWNSGCDSQPHIYSIFGISKSHLQSEESTRNAPLSRYRKIRQRFAQITQPVGGRIKLHHFSQPLRPWQLGAHCQPTPPCSSSSVID